MAQSGILPKAPLHPRFGNARLQRWITVAATSVGMDDTNFVVATLDPNFCALKRVTARVFNNSFKRSNAGASNRCRRQKRKGNNGSN